MSMEPAALNPNPGFPNRARHLIVGLGEVLWDLLPSGAQLGGAPANFARMTALLGDDAVIASRVGRDARGDETIANLQRAGLTTAHVQVDDAHPTGTVLVQLDHRGKPTFAIQEGVAWDYLEATAAWRELAARADAVCFGTLAQRSLSSRAAIRDFLNATRREALILFDVNLRSPFYAAAVVKESLQFANVVKLNDEELPLVIELTGLSAGSEIEAARHLRRAFDLRLVCVTRGERGSVLVSAEQEVVDPGVRVTIADTVGAGDAFSAALVHHLLRGASLERISAAANRLGSWVASQVGATPAVDAEVVAEIVEGKEQPGKDQRKG